MNCPNHKSVMRCSPSRYGPRYACDEPGCTVVCWNNKTSTPADAETRALRSRCHALFDERWKSGRESRDESYRWLRRVMGLTREDAHIGKFSKAQCEQLLAILGAS